MNQAKEAIDKRIHELFGDFPERTDWADDLARRAVALAIDAADFVDLDRWTVDQQMAWALAVAVATEVRGLRRQAEQARTVYVQGQVDAARETLREQFKSPDFMAEFVRDAAVILDGQGKSAEANTLRDAATVLDTEF